MSEHALAVARTAAERAGQIIQNGLAQARKVAHKSRFDLVTDVDRASESAILEVLSREYPQATIVAEESAAQGNRSASEVWLVDPLDGTTNYAHGYPFFCCSLAYCRDGRCEAGLVFDPVRKERFEARRTVGAWLNDQPIKVSQTTALTQSLLSTGFPADRCEQELTNLDRFAALTMRTRGVRRGGSAALDLCYTAAGRLDGYWEFRIFPWDVAAGALIVQEAGGRVSRCDGGEFDGSGLDTCASNGVLHQELLQALQQTHPEGPIYG